MNVPGTPENPMPKTYVLDMQNVTDCVAEDFKRTLQRGAKSWAELLLERYVSRAGGLTNTEIMVK